MAFHSNMGIYGGTCAAAAMNDACSGGPWAAIEVQMHPN